MKIVILSVWFSEKMGYAENCLPRAMAALGHEVHVITSTAQVYYNNPEYDLIYKPYLGLPVVPAETKNIDGYILHRLDFACIQGKIYLKGLGRKLRIIDPDVVQTFDVFSFLTLQGAYYKLKLGYKYFTANHIVESVFPLLNKDKNSVLRKIVFWFTRSIPGSIVSMVTSRCYPATIDAVKIAVTYYKIPRRKVLLAPLGVETDLFHPVEDDTDQSRILFRRSIGVKDEEILCIYTGRLTEGKNPLCLAEAVSRLAEKNEPFKALFLGDGPQSAEIRGMQNCVLYKFVPYFELAFFYRCSDLGVWPRQESTSMLDATSCGLPIIISNKVQAVERIEGNGTTYAENDVDDLMRVLISLKDSSLRKKLSEAGVKKIRNKFSWTKIAADRITDYQKFLTN